MTKGFWKTRLGIELMFSTIAAIFAAIVVFCLLTYIEVGQIKRLLQDENYIKENTERVVSELQNYVDRNQITVTDMPAIDRWVRQKRNVVLSVYDGNRVIYDSTIVNFFNEERNWVREDDHYRKLYQLNLKDRTVSVEMLCFLEYKYSTQVNYIKISVSLLVFAVTMLLLIQRKTRYIHQLVNDIGILEGGNLDYSITVKGHDEIAHLAKSIDEMRLAFIERQEKEQSLIHSSHKLVTAMSHDLRTPLTILIGYLDILEGKKYTSGEEQDKFITKSREKAYLIKQLSDKIFEYFLAFDSSGEKMEKNLYNTNVVHEMLEDYIFNLEEKGYLIEYTPKAECINLLLDMRYINRVFDNIFSNIIKYADKQQKVSITTTSKSNEVWIQMSNGIDKHADHLESSNIGLEICKRFMEQHKGLFFTKYEDNKFTATVLFKSQQ